MFSHLAGRFCRSSSKAVLKKVIVCQFGWMFFHDITFSFESEIDLPGSFDTELAKSGRSQKEKCGKLYPEFSKTHSLYLQVMLQ